MNINRFRIVVLAVLALLMVGLSSCHSSRLAQGRDDIYGDNVGGRRPDRNKGDVVRRDGDGKAFDKGSIHASGKARGVIDAAYDWLGVPYLYGGNSPSGTDCSGLVCMAFEKGAGMKLPRSSREQAKYSHSISLDKIEPGDLVFFVSRAGGDRINHVAIYIGDNSIIHATTSRGVAITRLDDNYWRSHYWGCGRVL